MSNKIRHFLVNILIFAIAFPAITSCGDGSKSPEFDDNEILTVSGIFIKTDGTALSGKNVYLQNLRRTGYIDYTEVAIATISNLLFSMLSVAWFFPFYIFGFGQKNSMAPNMNENTGKVKPNYFNSNASTDTNGKFSFKVRAGDLLRDKDAGINIDLINDSSTSKYGKFTFVLKDKETDLGTVYLCDLTEITVTETANDITISWTAPTFEVNKYFVNIGMQEDNALVWSEEVASDQTSLTLSKTVFSGLKTKVAVLAYQKFEDDTKISCLTPTKNIEIETPITSLADDKVAQTNNIKFMITSLTNRSLSDEVYFEAFDTYYFVLDLETPTTVSNIVFHNLLLKSSGNVTVSTSDDNINWTEAATAEEKRFLTITPAAPVTARFFKVTFSSNMVDLKELTLN